MMFVQTMNTITMQEDHFIEIAKELFSKVNYKETVRSLP